MYDKFRFRKDIGKNGFIIVVDEWNKFGSHVVGANTIDTFNKRLDKFMDGWILMFLKDPA